MRETRSLLGLYFVQIREILCRDKKDTLVEITLPKDNSQIFASRYKTVLPSKEALKQLIEGKTSSL